MATFWLQPNAAACMQLHRQMNRFTFVIQQLFADLTKICLQQTLITAIRRHNISTHSNFSIAVFFFFFFRSFSRSWKENFCQVEIQRQRSNSFLRCHHEPHAGENISKKCVLHKFRFYLRQESTAVLTETNRRKKCEQECWSALCGINFFAEPLSLAMRHLCVKKGCNSEESRSERLHLGVWQASSDHFSWFTTKSEWVS